MVTWF